MMDARAAGTQKDAGAASFSHVEAIRVRWSESDPQGIVFNAKYVEYFDIAMTEYWRRLGVEFTDPDPEAGELFAVHAEVDYKAPARFDDILQVGVSCERIGRTSLSFAFEIRCDGRLLATGRMVYANADAAARKSKPLPERLRERLTAFEGP